ncbi:helix-turn-helix transcriptional regulator [Aestuariispira insulae]|uniref:AraC family transcriptional regulator n=1 Tax=Aestuariispira insulae TaxID=1461337 RepID=A0A3D9H4S2_9PROT|nr:AraC family transcriptional regulator [Aestuariispira insulae]RED44171.1 AraC family transcriptional regulator [Aestuariispira insulae]
MRQDDKQDISASRQRARDTGISLRSLSMRPPAGNSEPFQVTSPQLLPDDLVVRGRMHDHDGLTGLKIHATDTIEMHDLVKEWLMKPAFVVAITLEGCLDVRLAEKSFTLGRGTGPAGQFWNLTRTEPMQRLSKKGTHIRKALIVVPREWLLRLADDQSHLHETFPAILSEHLSIGCWKPSNHALSLAEQLINPGNDPHLLQVLSREGKAMEIVHEAIASLSPARQDSLPSTREARRAQCVRQHIIDHLDEEISLTGLSTILGMSIASMQNAFKRTYHQTIAEFCREQRLTRAKQAIELEGKPVSEAAYQAGYDSPASFSTAFKKLFGFPPSGCKV